MDDHLSFCYYTILRLVFPRLPLFKNAGNGSLDAFPASLPFLLMNAKKSRMPSIRDFLLLILQFFVFFCREDTRAGQEPFPLCAFE